jgi:Protein of unknown function (DUF2971)
LADSVLYHYTSLDGLVGIVRSRSMWASSIRHLNDSSEFRYALDLVQSEILVMPKGASGSYGRMLDEYRAAFSGMGEGTVYVSSFSTEGDLLSQWRAYGTPGSTVAVGFRSGALQSAALASGYRLLPCTYKRAAQVASLKRRFSAAQLQKLENGPFVFAADVLNLAPALKHPSFAEESEWRLISSVPASGTLCFRPSGALLVPYRVVPLVVDGGLPICEIVLGPNAHSAENVFAIRLLLAENGLSTCEVRVSDAPFRVR